MVARRVQCNYSPRSQVKLFHGDLKPNNIGVKIKDACALPINTFTDLRVVVYDWGCDDDTVVCGTRPYSVRTFWKDYPGCSPSPDATMADYFQVLMVCVKLAIMKSSGLAW